MRSSILPDDGGLRTTGWPQWSALHFYVGLADVVEHQEQLDTRIEIVTPENIAFQYRIAGPFRRFLAYFIDVLVRVAFSIVVMIVLAIAGIAGLSGIALGVWLIIWFLVDWFYGGVFEALWNGQTPGKWLVGVRVMTAEGQPIQGWQAVLRNFLRAADAMPVIGFIPTYQIGFWSSLISPRFQRLGDFAAGTMVVVDEPAMTIGLKKIDDANARELAEQLPKNFRASRSLAKSISLYVERRHLFSPRRRIEIAWHLAEPLRLKFDLPSGTHPDVLLCALYHRIFITDRPDESVVMAVEAPPVQPLPTLGQRDAVDPHSITIRT